MNILSYRGLGYLRKVSCTALFLFGLLVESSGQGIPVDFNSIPKSGTALIYCHQDDDLIWMLPFWNISETFICAAMPTTPRFRQIIHNQQIYLDYYGYHIDYESNYIHPWGEIENEEYQYYYWSSHDPDYAYIGIDHLLATWVNNETDRKEINRIKAKIEQYIASPDLSRIITHNNWGEYGHFQHKEVNKAVRELAVKYRKDVWMLGCDNGDFQDISVPSGITYTMAEFDTVLFDAIREIYIHPNNWWTWRTEYKPSGYHTFVKVVNAGNDKSNLLTGETVTVPGPPQYKSGSYIFDGIDDYMTLAGNNYTSFSIAMWIRPDEIKSMDISRMAEYPSSSTYDRNLYLHGNGRVSARIYDGQLRTVTSSTSLSAGAWTHIIMTGNGSTLKLYINGILEGYVDAGSAISSYASPEFVLGQAQVTSSFFKGQIWDVRFYDYALTESDITSIYGAPRPNYGIDYFNERTNNPVPSTDEYSYNADMSDAVSGTGQKIALIPGRDVYIRAKATESRLASEIQHLVVDPRPSSPSLSIDFINERTNQPVEENIEYSTSSSCTNPISGTGIQITVMPGQDLYFRLKATSCSFSSWITHLIIPDRSSPPEVSIDFANESTLQPVDSTVEYSASADHTDPISGTGKRIAVVPEQDLYFWLKATSCSFCSWVTHLSVPERPSPPDISIDFANESTLQSVDTTIEYSESEDCACTVVGAGSRITLIPQTDLYFRVKATSCSFNSTVTHLSVPVRPSRPSITIDYITETTSSIPLLIEYSADSTMVSARPGGDSAIGITPGSHLYFRAKATGSSFPSEIQHLMIPERPPAPDYGINYTTTQTAENVLPSDIYSCHADMSDPVSGINTPAILIPGNDVYFRTSATDTSFSSDVQHLIVKQRPEMSKFSIDYFHEQTFEPVSPGVEYSTDPQSFTSCGTGVPVALNPGENLYLRLKATDTSFCSENTSLIVKPRPEAPAFTIDFYAEQTSERINTSTEYSADGDFLTASSGIGLPVKVNPGENIFFRTKSTDSTFTSYAGVLEIPQRPLLAYWGKDTISTTVFEVKANLPSTMTGFDLSKIAVENGYAQNLRTGDYFDVIPRKIGMIQVSISPNEFDNASFASNQINVFFKGPDAGFEEIGEDDITVYPVPCHDGLVHVYFSKPGHYKMELFSPAGRLVQEQMVYGNGLVTITINEAKGVYYLWIASTNTQTYRKIILY
jgi:hypothetical protein